MSQIVLLTLAVILLLYGSSTHTHTHRPTVSNHDIIITTGQTVTTNAGAVKQTLKIATAAQSHYMY